MTQVTATKSTLKLSTVLRRNVLWIVFGSAIGGVIFYSLAMLISLTIIVNMKIDSFQNFVLVVKIFQFIPMIGLIIGGVVAAPIGAYIIKFFKPTILLRMVGVLIIITSIYNIYKSFS